MVARRYGIYLLVFTFDISLVRCAHSFDIECEHEKINSISPSVHVLFCLLYKHTDDGVFDDFPKISEDFSNCPEDQTNVPEHFPRIFENFRRFPKIAEHFRVRPEDVSMIHQRI